MEFLEHRLLDVVRFVHRKAHTRDYAIGRHDGAHRSVPSPPALSVRVDLGHWKVNLVHMQRGSAAASAAPLIRPLECTSEAGRSEAHPTVVLPFQVGISRVDFVYVELSAYLVFGASPVVVRTRRYVIERPTLRFKSHLRPWCSPARRSSSASSHSRQPLLRASVDSSSSESSHKNPSRRPCRSRLHRTSSIQRAGLCKHSVREVPFGGTHTAHAVDTPGRPGSAQKIGCSLSPIPIGGGTVSPPGSHHLSSLGEPRSTLSATALRGLSAPHPRSDRRQRACRRGSHREPASRAGPLHRSHRTRQLVGPP